MTPPTNKEEVYGKYLSGMVWRSIAEILVRIRSIILLPILTRIFGLVEYGIWTQISTTASLLSTLGNFGFGAAMRRYLPGLPKDGFKNQFWMSISAVVFGATIIAIPALHFREQIATAFFNGKENSVFVIAGVLLMYSKVIQAHLVLFFRLSLRFRTFSFLLVFQSVIALVAYVVSAIVGRDLLLLSITAVISDFFLTVIILWAVIRSLGIGRPDFEKLSSYLKFGLPSLPRAFLSWALNSSDRYFIAFFLGTGTVAIYGVAYGVALWPITIVMTPVWSTMPASVNTLWNAGQKTEALSLLRTTFKYAFVLLVPVACVTVFWGKSILEVYAGPNYSEGSSILFFVVLAYLINYVSQFYRFAFDWKEKTNIYLVSFTLAVVVNLTFNSIFIPRIGYFAAGLATFLSYGILFVVEYTYARRLMDLELPVNTILAASLIGGLFSFGISSFPLEGWGDFLWQTGFFGLAYFGFLFLLRIINMKDLLYLHKRIRKK